MIKSLRWKLLTWHAVILCCLTLAFAVLTYVNLKNSFQHEIDAFLTAQAMQLISVISKNVENSFDIELSSEQVKLFGEDGPNAVYYRIWDRNGMMVDSSHPSLDIPQPDSPGQRTRGANREVYVRGNDGSLILVGTNASQQFLQMQRQAGIAIAVGGAVLALVFLGGWFLIGRALAPISRISRAACAISASNLSERIDRDHMESELSDLAATINETFDRLELAFERQSRFTADTSHQLRTPLAVIMANAELALQKQRSVEEYRQTLSSILDSSKQMDTVVKDLLSLARADTDQIHLKKQQLEISELVEQTCAVVAPLAGDRHITITKHLVPVYVWGDPYRLTEAFSNVLTNAINYNSHRGNITVTLRRNGSSAQLDIADTGPGIPSQDRQQIFNRFFRGGHDNDGSVKGSGLGLAIAKEILEVHSGSIELASTGKQGSLFVIKLPLA